VNVQGFALHLALDFLADFPPDLGTKGNVL
jgi:hypothetical protein